MEMAYMGFTQEAGVRRFRFECQIELPRPAAAPRRTVQFVVSADMALFLRHSIPIQDGPAICREVLVEATSSIPENEIVSGSYPVEEMHMVSVAAARTADAQAKSARRHKPPVRVK
jgi:hypothetical protein